MNFHAMTRNELEQALVGPHAEGAEGVQYWTTTGSAFGLLPANFSTARTATMTDADKIDNLLAQRRELMDKIEEQIDERGRIIERIQIAPDSPIARLRARHQRWIDPQPDRATDTCTKCPEAWPCDTIAALDALEAEAEWLRAQAAKALDAQRAEIDALQARLDAATVLIREAMEERHTTHARTMKATTVCGSPIGTSIATCPNCAPYRAWLAGDKGAGNE